MTAQEIFNKVAQHLITQNAKALNVLGVCTYLDSSSGRKCAIGCLIPDGHRAQAYNSGVTSMLYRNPDLRDAILPEDIKECYEFLFQLQAIHDSTTVSDWKSELITFANRWNLKIPTCLAA